MLQNIKLPKKSLVLKKSKYFFKILNEKEKSVFQIATTVFLVSLIVLIFSVYYENTVKIPAFGGKYSEGIIGQPQLLNPIYSSASDVDRDISYILFSGIVKHDFQGNIIPNLAENIYSQESVFEITLKDNLKWSDGQDLTADDIVFTIEAIQNPKTRSPLRPDWVGIRVEKVSDLTVRFYLEKESSIFPNRLFVEPIPKHIWENVNYESFPLSNYNLNPVGSGPYRFKSIERNGSERIKSIVLEVNPFYHGKKPKIEEISFVFFNNTDELIVASRKNEIQGFAVVNPKDYDEIIEKTKLNGHNFRIPRVFGLFFNLEGDSNLIKDKEFREALIYAIDKQAIMENVLNSRGQIINSSLLGEIYDFSFDYSYQFDIDKSNSMLDNLGLTLKEDGYREKVLEQSRVFEFKSDLNVGSQGEEVRQLQKCLIDNNFYDKEITGFYGDDTRDAVNNFQEHFKDEILTPGGFTKGTGMVSENTRIKLNELCQFTPEITTQALFTITTVNQPLMAETAQELKRQLQNVGVKVDISLLEITELERDVIKPRNYEILLFGKALDIIPDYFPFWHSSQKSEYGFNLSMYTNDNADKLLERLRIESGIKETKQELNNIINQDLPTIFLFNPNYILFTSSKIKGISKGLIFNPAQRFNNIENWYIKTKRIKK